VHFVSRACSARERVSSTRSIFQGPGSIKGMEPATEQPRLRYPIFPTAPRVAGNTRHRELPGGKIDCGIGSNRPPEGPAELLFSFFIIIFEKFDIRCVPRTFQGGIGPRNAVRRRLRVKWMHCSGFSL
jgi:hypothetical protein